MSKVAVVYWSGTGNTQSMAEAVAEGAKDAGADVALLEAASFNKDKAGDFQSIAFGCPAMGDEELEDTVFDPMFTDVEGSLSGKKVVLFGSYDWGDGEWMRNWESRCSDSGVTLFADSVLANNTPDDDALNKCKALGKALV